MYINCVYLQDVQHPAETGFTPKLQWSVVGLDIINKYERFLGYVSETKIFPLAFIVQNNGDDSISNVTVTVSFLVLYTCMIIYADKCKKMYKGDIYDIKEENAVLLKPFQEWKLCDDWLPCF